MHTHPIETSDTLVIKVGSSSLFDLETNQLRTAWFTSFIHDLAALRQSGKQVVIVSSGAIAFGRHILGLEDVSTKLEEKQAAAACGQMILTNHFQSAFQNHTIHTAQILITLEDSNDRRRYLNARATLQTLLSYGIIPIINENDTITTKEIRLGDNDRLAARVADMVSADCLILLSDIDGLYTSNPALDASAQLIEQVHQIDDTIYNYAGDSHSSVGTGGMLTKIQAAEMAAMSGCHTIIANGEYQHPLKRLIDGAAHTRFIAQSTPQNARQAWISNQINISGQIFIDDGAITALKNGRSLLPAGVHNVVGDFTRGDVISICSLQHDEIARGLVNYNSHDTSRIQGKQNHEIEGILGYSHRECLVHRNDLVFL